MNDKFTNTKVTELTPNEYIINKKTIKIKNNKKPGLVIFYYYWCGFCNLIAPELLKLAEKKDINIYAIHGDNEYNQDAFRFLQIQGVPHLRFVLSNGNISSVFTGNRTSNDIYKFIKNENNKLVKKPVKKVVKKPVKKVVKKPVKKVVKKVVKKQVKKVVKKPAKKVVKNKL